MVTLRKPVLKLGSDTLETHITLSRNGHEYLYVCMYLALAGSDGQSLYLPYLHRLATDNRVRAGQRVAMRGWVWGWDIVAGGPPGAETLLVLVTGAAGDPSSLGREKAGLSIK